MERPDAPLNVSNCPLKSHGLPNARIAYVYQPAEETVYSESTGDSVTSLVATVRLQ